MHTDKGNGQGIEPYQISHVIGLVQGHERNCETNGYIVSDRLRHMKPRHPVPVPFYHTLEDGAIQNARQTEVKENLELLYAKPSKRPSRKYDD